VGIELPQCFETRPHVLEEFVAERLAVGRVVGAVEAAERARNQSLSTSRRAMATVGTAAAGRYPAKVEESGSSISGCEPNTA
jgi:hypothetical protein